MLAQQIPQERLADCLALLNADGYSEEKIQPKDIKLQTGGLFNFLLRVETEKDVVYFKQYLDNVPNSTYTPPSIPARDRAQLAYEVQKLASDASLREGLKVVPDLIIFDPALSAFLMREANGNQTLVEFLSKGEIPEILLTQLPVALACLHQATYKRFPISSIFGNREFRDFKLNLQYDGILPFVNEAEGDSVMRCKQQYQEKAECVTHGDINSRNILVGGNSIGVIDFEQSHLGSPAYDVAYILSELMISSYQYSKSKYFGNILNSFLNNYFTIFDESKRYEIELEITQHLAIQVIYRFVGPSRASWTFYVDEDKKLDILQRCRDMLLEYKPVSSIIF